MTDLELIDLAKKAMQNAYVPYSHFRVGAALMVEDGSVYTGCNIENASFGATICAERTAAVKAVSEGHTRFTRIAIVSSSGEYTHPCGICRQFLSEFADMDFEFVFYDETKGIKTVPFRDEFPAAFTEFVGEE